MNGSEFISAKTVDTFSEMFKLAPNAMAPGYGLAENVCLATFASQDYRTLKLDYEAYQQHKAVPVIDGENVKELVSVGAPVKDLTVVIANPKTKKVYPDLRIGEIFISGDSVADGYWGNLKDNANFRVKLEGYDNSFYKTGDLGFLYEGHLYITGRIKEMLIVNGHNIYPSDLQVVLQQKIPALSTSAVGFFSFNNGTKEQVVAVVESSPEEDFAKRVRQINAAVSERFGFSFYDIVFVPHRSIPRTDNSKLQMLKARNMYLDGKLNILFSSHAYRTGTSESNLIDRSLEKADEILLQVKSVFEKVLNIEQYSLTDSFLELGGDSLMGFELVNKIEQRFHIKLDLREVLQDSSVAGVSNYVRRVLSGAKSGVKPINLEQECQLDSSIQLTADYEKPVSECSHILLTGATGFLGAQLIRAIIAQYPKEDLKLYCLVRADSVESGMERLKKNMQHYECWKDSYQEFLHPVIGDLSSPNLGISDEIWQMLSNDVEIIYHNGALLNFVFPYQFLKETNVHGTIETLRLACAGKPKYYNFVSSYSVYDTPNNKGKRVYENDPLSVSQGFALSYSETKWVSEKLVGIAQKRGLHAVIYRPGDITGAANGIWDMEDMVSRIIVGMIQMQAIPRTSYCFHMTPVDFVADALVCISRKTEALDRKFNLINPKTLPLKELVAHVRACGYPVHYISFPAWKKRLKQSDATQNAMTLLACLFERGTETNPGVLRHFVGKDTTYDMTNTTLLLNQSGITCPPIDKKMIDAYLKYFKKLGYIKS
jgi:thioester reductase-like protein